MTLTISDDHLYDLYMKEYPVSETRERLAELLDEARVTGEPFAVTRRGNRVAVVLDSESFERLSATADDAIDRAAVLLSREEDDYLPWDEVKAELGWA